MTKPLYVVQKKVGRFFGWRDVQSYENEQPAKDLVDSLNEIEPGKEHRMVQK